MLTDTVTKYLLLSKSLFSCFNTVYTFIPLNIVTVYNIHKCTMLSFSENSKILKHKFSNPLKTNIWGTIIIFIFYALKYLISTIVTSSCKIIIVVKFSLWTNIQLLSSVWFIIQTHCLSHLPDKVLEMSTLSLQINNQILYHFAVVG